MHIPTSMSQSTKYINACYLLNSSTSLVWYSNLYVTKTKQVLKKNIEPFWQSNEPLFRILKDLSVENKLLVLLEIGKDSEKIKTNNKSLHITNLCFHEKTFMATC